MRMCRMTRMRPGLVDPESFHPRAPEAEPRTPANQPGANGAPREAVRNFTDAS
jgi:hypothetical protein